MLEEGVAANLGIYKVTGVKQITDCYVTTTLTTGYTRVTLTVRLS